MKKVSDIKSFHDELQFLEKCLKLIGHWPDHSKSGQIKFFISFTVSMITTLSAIGGCLTHTGNHERKMNSIFVTSIYVHIIMSQILFKYKKPIVKEISYQMDENWQHFKYLSLSSQQLMQNNAIKTYRRTILVFFMLHCGEIVWFVHPLVKSIIFEEAYLIIDAWYPFSWKYSPCFEIMFGFQTLCLIINVFICATMSSYVLLILYHFSGQIDVLIETIKKFQGEINHQKSRKFNCQTTNEKQIKINCCCIKCIVDKHNKLTNCIKSIDSALNGTMFLHLIIGTISFCFNSYELIKHYQNGHIFAFIYHIAYVSSIMPYFFMCCWGCNEILEKSQNVGDALYNLPWYNYKNNEIKKMFVVLINRAHKPMKITGCRFFIISLRCYASWLVKGIEYFSVLAAFMSLYNTRKT